MWRREIHFWSSYQILTQCYVIVGTSAQDEDKSLATVSFDSNEKSAVEKFLFPDKEELPDDFSMPIWDHLDELRERVLVAAIAAGVAVLTCFCFSKDLVVFLEAPVASQGVRFLQLSPGEFFFTTFKVCLYNSCWFAENDCHPQMGLFLL